MSSTQSSSTEEWMFLESKLKALEEKCKRRGNGRDQVALKKLVNDLRISVSAKAQMQSEDQFENNKSTRRRRYTDDVVDDDEGSITTISTASLSASQQSLFGESNSSLLSNGTTTSRVSFSTSIVSDVWTRPRTLKEDIPTLYWSSKTIRDNKRLKVKESVEPAAAEEEVKCEPVTLSQGYSKPQPTTCTNNNAKQEKKSSSSSRKTKWLARFKKTQPSKAEI